MLLYHVALSLHLIGIVSWFAGLFYLVRLCIYHREALDKSNPEKEILIDQFTLMQNRLWKVITVPALWITLATGLFLLGYSHVYNEIWFAIKTAFLILLFGYHIYCRRIMKQLQNGQTKWTSTKLRVYNEISTLLLFSIVFCVKLKDPIVIGLALISVSCLGVFMFLIIKLLKDK